MVARTSTILTVLAVGFLAFDGAARLVGFAPYAQATVRYGFPPGLAPWIGATLLVITTLYAIPRTSLLGAVLLTGYLGGAVATELRVAEAWVFPLVLGGLVWAGLVLRRPELRAVLSAGKHETSRGPG